MENNHCHICCHTITRDGVNGELFSTSTHLMLHKLSSWEENIFLKKLFLVFLWLVYEEWKLVYLSWDIVLPRAENILFYKKECHKFPLLFLLSLIHSLPLSRFLFFSNYFCYKPNKIKQTFNCGFY